MRTVWLGRLSLWGRARSDVRWRASRWALVVAAAACLVAAPAVVGQGQTQVRIEPASVQLGTGESVTLQIVVADVQELYGLDVRLAFDPSQVEVLGADSEKEGVQIVHLLYTFPCYTSCTGGLRSLCLSPHTKQVSAQAIGSDSGEGILSCYLSCALIGCADQVAAGQG